MNSATMLTFISHRDYNLMRRVNRWRAPRWIRIWMLCATRAGDGWLWYGLGLVILLFGGHERFRAVAAGMLAEGLALTLFLRLKKAARRQRPSALGAHPWATLLPPDQFSFPSGHTTTAFAVCVSISMFYPAFTIALLFCAFSVGASRIVLGMHFLSDVLAGVAIGSVMAWVAVHAVRLL